MAPPKKTDAPAASASAEPDDPLDSHRLKGLEPDNLLAFLALLGLLRALDAARPDWRARAFFDLDRPPIRPVLTLATPQTRRAIAEAAGEGVSELARVHRFSGRADLNHSAKEAHAAFQQAEDRLDAALAAKDAENAREATREVDLLSALMSEGAIKTADDKVWPAPLCFLFGQGHQHFLSRLEAVPARAEPPARGRGKKAVAISGADALSEALFDPWQRLDNVEGLRWDPAEDRRYALRAVNPSDDPATLQHGANRLAAIGLPVLSGTTILRRRETRFLTRGTSYVAGGGIAITWPLWTRPARLAGIRALLAHPDLAGETGDFARLDALGIARVMRAERISVGKFFNATPAHSLDLARRSPNS